MTNLAILFPITKICSEKLNQAYSYYLSLSIVLEYNTVLALQENDILYFVGDCSLILSWNVQKGWQFPCSGITAIK